MTHCARLAARLLVVAFSVIAAPAQADELQDINGLLKQGQHAKALERVDQYLAQNPGDPNARFTKGLILAEQNRTAEAIDVFSALTQDYPQLPEPYNNLAVLYASQGQYEKARQQLEKSIRTHPSYATAYENLGDVYTKLASQAYDKALQFDSSNATAKNKLSLIRELISSGRPTAVAGAAPATARAEASPQAVEGKTLAQAPPATSGDKRGRGNKGGEQAVLETVLAWANAWSQRKVETYLAFYAKDFKTPKGEARAAWETARRDRISGAKRIEVAVESPKVMLMDESSATVSFRQLYRSDTLKVSSRKTLVMVRDEGRWAILEERSGS
jgi:tetratricopeptide (TPR) repeat protein